MITLVKILYTLGRNNSWLISLILSVRNVIRQVFITLKRTKARLFRNGISEAGFRKSLRPEFSTEADFLASYKGRKERNFFFQPEFKDEWITAILQITPQAKDLILRAANSACDHVFDLLGSGPTDLGWPIDWHVDFKSGFRWDPSQYYLDIRPAPYPGGYDLKMPWELSRCQHFPWLGQAYWLTGDEKYPREFCAQIEDWIRLNPPEFGVNWACAMDIAIRAVNWLWGYAFFQASPSLDDAFRLEFCKSLLLHGRHIRANLERTITFASNHYLSNLVGLIYLGFLLPELKEAKGWREFGLKELEREMFRQVHPDGGNFEASTSYHRLATELFLSATLLAQRNGHIFSQGYMERLEAMFDFIFHLTKPDGTVALIGDQDNGRLYRLKIWPEPAQEWLDFRPLLATGSILFKRPEWAKAALNHWEEAIWFYGEEVVVVYRQACGHPAADRASKAFEESGIYILRSSDLHATMDIGSIGQNGRGGHAHNDSMSFELFASGQTWIIDPGSFLYTSDYEERNLFRSTTYHNTLAPDGSEQNNFDARLLFRLNDESETRVVSWQPKIGNLVAEFQRRVGPTWTHKRSFQLDRERSALLLADLMTGTESVCRLYFHFAPGLDVQTVDVPYPGFQMNSADGQIARLFLVLDDGMSPHLTNGWVSRSYGSRELGKIGSFEVRHGREYKTIILLPSHGDSFRRIEEMLRHERLSH